MGKIMKNGIPYGGSSSLASDVTYDNTSTDLSATNVQSAITELNGKAKTGSYTPQGSVTVDYTQNVYTPASGTVAAVASVGTLPSATYDSASETITFSVGTLPTTSNKSVIVAVTASTTTASTSGNLVGTAATIEVR
jgi:hypothetical protein